MRPPSHEWRSLVRRRDDGASQRTRREVGLPIDRPVVMSGHQPTLWHPGILAKWLAIVHAAGRHAWHAAWVSVDHDAVRPMALHWPVRRDDVLSAAGADLGGASLGTDVPACALPAMTPLALPTRAGAPALECVGMGLDAIRAALAAHATARSAAEQAVLATRDMIHGSVLPGQPAPTLVLASRLHETTLFRELVDRMRADPVACARAYNASVAGVEGVRPLDASGDVELPLWAMDGLARRAVRASMLARASAPLAPKALLLTLVLRLGACDLFIHGTGGGGLHEGEGYDRAADDWARRWLGAQLAPIATVSATLRLPLGEGAIVTHEDAARATWRAWHARHDPSMIGLEDLDVRRRDLVAAIAALPRRDRRRAEHFARLQGVLVEARERGHDRLATLDDAALLARGKAREDRVRADRTWPFALYSATMLRALSDRIAGEFAPAGVSPSVGHHTGVRM